MADESEISGDSPSDRPTEDESVKEKVRQGIREEMAHQKADEEKIHRYQRERGGEGPTGAEGSARVAKGTNGEKKPRFSIERRRLSDEIFLTIEETRKDLQLFSEMDEGKWLSGTIAVPLHIDEENSADSIHVPYIPTLTLTVASRVALNWVSRRMEGEQNLRRDTMTQLLKEVGPNKSVDDIIQNAPDVEPVLDVIVDDMVHGRGNLGFFQHGIDQHFIRDVSSDFYVKAKQNPIDQTQAIVAGLFQRLEYLHSNESQQVLQEMRGWHIWRERIKPGRPEYLPMVLDTYEKVKAKPKILRSLVSPIPSIKAHALEAVERDGGFLHEAGVKELQEMLEKGVTAVIPDVAYYGVMTDPEVVKRLLREYCGYDPQKEYVDLSQLPNEAEKVSDLTKKKWPIEWVNKRYALAMLQDPDAVAFTVEMAVKKTAVDEGGIGPARRNSGIASALKYDVYKRVPQPLIFTRYFEILEVNGISVPSAVNAGTAFSIQAFGGRHIGVAEEEFAIKPGESSELKIKVLWHYCLADREKTLRRIEQHR